MTERGIHCAELDDHLQAMDLGALVHEYRHYYDEFVRRWPQIAEHVKEIIPTCGGEALTVNADGAVVAICLLYLPLVVRQ